MSDRQLSQYWYHHLRVNRDMLMSHGAVWEFQMPTVVLDPHEAFEFEFITDERPVLWSGWEVYVPDIAGTGIYVISTLRENSVVLAGTQITGQPVNRDKPQVSPVLQFSYNATITVETGTPLGTYLSEANNPNMQNGAFWVLKPYTQYDVTMRNHVPAAFSFTCSYAYVVSNDANPAAGVAHHGVNGRSITFNDTDDDETNCFANFELVQIGTLIEANAANWTVTSVAQGLGNHTFGVEPFEFSSLEVQPFHFYLQQPGTASVSATVELSRLTRADLL